MKHSQSQLPDYFFLKFVGSGKVTLSRSTVKVVIKVGCLSRVVMVFVIVQPPRSRGHRTPYRTFELAPCFRLEWPLAAKFLNIQCTLGHASFETFLQLSSQS